MPVRRKGQLNCTVCEQDGAGLRVELGEPSAQLVSMESNEPVHLGDEQVDASGATEILDTRSMSCTGQGPNQCQIPEDKTLADLTVKRLPVLIVKPLKTKIALKKYRGVLECKVSQTDARVTWYKNNKELKASEKHSLISSGFYRQLVIKEVDLSDEDTYTCDAIDDKTSCQLLVEARSISILRHLKRVEVMEPHAARFEAEINLDPMKEPKWLLKGKLLKPSRDIEMEKERTVYRLILKKTNSSMSGPVHFKIGKSRSTAMLLVTEAPLMLVQPLSDIQAKEYGSVTLSCEFVPSPIMVRWFKGLSLLVASMKYVIKQEGTYAKLTIQDLRLEDSGEYRCLAGGSESKAVVTVKEIAKVEIPMHLEHVRVEEDRGTVISCKLSYADEQVRFLLNKKHHFPKKDIGIQHTGTRATLLLKRLPRADGTVTVRSGAIRESTALKIREVQPQYTREPPPRFTVTCTQSSLYCSPVFQYTKEKRIMVYNGKKNMRNSLDWDAKVSCEVKKPLSEMVWLKNRKTVGSFQQKGGLLQLSNTIHRESAVNCCESYGSPTKADQRVLIKDKMEDVERLERRKASFTCRFSLDKCRDVKWYPDRALIGSTDLIKIQSIPVDHHNHSPRTQSPRTQSNYGAITFKAGDYRSYPFQTGKGVTDEFKPKCRNEDVKAGESVFMHSQFSAPGQTVQWLKDRKVIKPQGKDQRNEKACCNKLQVNSARAEDIGGYTNKYGGRRTTAYAKVCDPKCFKSSARRETARPLSPVPHCASSASIVSAVHSSDHNTCEKVDFRFASVSERKYPGEQAVCRRSLMQPSTDKWLHYNWMENSAASDSSFFMLRPVTEMLETPRHRNVLSALSDLQNCNINCPSSDSSMYDDESSCERPTIEQQGVVFSQGSLSLRTRINDDELAETGEEHGSISCTFRPSDFQFHSATLPDSLHQSHQQSSHLIQRGPSRYNFGTKTFRNEICIPGENITQNHCMSLAHSSTPAWMTPQDQKYIKKNEEACHTLSSRISHDLSELLEEEYDAKAKSLQSLNHGSCFFSTDVSKPFSSENGNREGHFDEQKQTRNRSEFITKVPALSEVKESWEQRREEVCSHAEKAPKISQKTTDSRGNAQKQNQDAHTLQEPLCKNNKDNFKDITENGKGQSLTGIKLQLSYDTFVLPPEENTTAINGLPLCSERNILKTSDPNISVKLSPAKTESSTTTTSACNKHLNLRFQSYGSLTSLKKSDLVCIDYCENDDASQGIATRKEGDLKCMPPATSQYLIIPSEFKESREKHGAQQNYDADKEHYFIHSQTPRTDFSALNEEFSENISTFAITRLEVELCDPTEHTLPSSVNIDMSSPHRDMQTYDHRDVDKAKKSGVGRKPPLKGDDLTVKATTMSIPQLVSKDIIHKCVSTPDFNSKTPTEKCENTGLMHFFGKDSCIVRSESLLNRLVKKQRKGSSPSVMLQKDPPDKSITEKMKTPVSIISKYLNKQLLKQDRKTVLDRQIKNASQISAEDASQISPEEKKKYNIFSRFSATKRRNDTQIPLVETRSPSLKNRSGSEQRSHKTYTFLSEINRGHFSVIKLCQEDISKQLFAAKITPCGAEQRNVALQEYELLKQLSHAHLVLLHAAFLTPRYVVLVEELCPGRELLHNLADRDLYAEMHMTELLIQVLRAVDYLHHNHVVHLDLKSENILVTDCNFVKIVDLGSAQRFSPGQYLSVEHIQGKAKPKEYIVLPKAPEILEGQGVGPEIDIWAIGVLAFIMMSADHPFHSDVPCERDRNIKRGQIQFRRCYPGLSEGAIDFVRRTLNNKPWGRPSAVECLQMTWIQGTYKSSRPQRSVVCFSTEKLQAYLREQETRRDSSRIKAEVTLFE